MTATPHISIPRTWARLVSLLASRDRVVLASAGVAMLGSAVGKALFPLLIGSVIGHAVASGQGMQALAGALPVVAAVILAQLLLETLRRQLVEVVATAFERDVRVRSYTKLLHGDVDALRSELTGSVYGSANRSVEGATKLLKLGAMDLLPAVIGSVCAVSAALAKDWRVGLVMAGVIPTGFLLVRWQIRNQAGVRIRLRNQKARIDGKVPEALTAIESIRSTGAEGHILRTIAGMCDELRRVELAHHRAMSLFDCGKALNEAFWLVATLASAAVLRGAGIMDIGDLLAFLMLTLAVHAPLRDLHRILDETSECAQLADELLTTLERDDDTGFAEGERALDADRPVLELRDLRFRHKRSPDPVLTGVNLCIRAGERVGIAGRSGCGKSTMLRVLRRLTHGATGEVLVGGVPLEKLGHAQLSGMIGFVTQEPQILNGTVADNIRFGLAATDAEVRAAARRANVHDEIMRMPDGYATVVEERGASVSVGQKQRISIARALLRNPRILLLDEPTSALDPVTERAVQKTIDDLTDVTVVMVAHRLDTLRNLDRVVVLDGGRVVDDGPFDVLARDRGAFAAMLEAQRAVGDEVTLVA